MKKGPIKKITGVILLILILAGISYFVWYMFIRKPTVELLKIWGCEYKWEKTYWNETYKSLFVHCEVRLTEALNPDKYTVSFWLSKVYDGDKVISYTEWLWASGGTSSSACFDEATTEPQNITLIARDINLTSNTIGLDFGWRISKYRPLAWEDEIIAEGNYHKSDISLKRQVSTYVLTVKSEPIQGIPFSIDGITNSTPWSQTLPAVNYTIRMPITYTDPVTGLKYTFSGWKDGSINAIRNVTLDRDLSIIANYSPPPKGAVSFNITFRRVIIEEPWNTGDVYLFLGDKEIENYTIPTFEFYYGYKVDSPQALTFKNNGTSSLYVALVPYEVPQGVEFTMYIVDGEPRWRYEDYLGKECDYIRVYYGGGTVTFYLRIKITEPLEFDTYDIKIDIVIASFESTIREITGA